MKRPRRSVRSARNQMPVVLGRPREHAPLPLRRNRRAVMAGNSRFPCRLLQDQRRETSREGHHQAAGNWLCSAASSPGRGSAAWAAS
jgi:hypothetical protein